jgi:hypothetical protein
VLLGDVVDELLDEDRLADAGAAEEADLAALHVRGDEIDDLDARLERLDRRRQVAELRRITVDRPALVSSAIGSSSSIDWPITFQSRPRVAGPTGTEIGPAVSTQTAPRESRRSSPWRRRARGRPRGAAAPPRQRAAGVALADLDLEGRVDLGEPVGNTASMTTPLILDYRPVFVRSDPFSAWFSSVVASAVSSGPPTGNESISKSGRRVGRTR